MAFMAHERKECFKQNEKDNWLRTIILENFLELPSYITSKDSNIQYISWHLFYDLRRALLFKHYYAASYILKQLEHLHVRCWIAPSYKLENMPSLQEASKTATAYVMVTAQVNEDRAIRLFNKKQYTRGYCAFSKVGSRCRFFIISKRQQTSKEYTSCYGTIGEMKKESY